MKPFLTYSNQNLEKKINSYNRNLFSISDESKNNRIHSFSRLKNIKPKEKINNISNKPRKFLKLPKPNMNILNAKTSSESELKSTIYINDKFNIQKNLNNLENIPKKNNIQNFSKNGNENIKQKIKNNSKKNSIDYLIRIYKNKNKGNINSNKQKNEINTYYLFKKNNLNYKKSSSKNKNCIINYYFKKGLNSHTIESKIYNSNNDILDLDRKTQKTKISQTTKNNTTTQLSNLLNAKLINSITQNNLKISAMSHKGFKKTNLNNIEKQKTKNKGHSKKLIELKSQQKLLFISYQNLQFFNQKSPIYRLNNTISSNSLIDSSDISKSNLGNIKNKIKKQNLIENEKNNIFTKFKTHSHFDLWENKSTKYRLIARKTNNCLEKEVSYSNENNPVYQKRNINFREKTEMRGIFEKKENNLSSIKSKNKNHNETLNDLKKLNKKRVIHKNENLKKNSIKKIDSKKEKNDLKIKNENKNNCKKNTNDTNILTDKIKKKNLLKNNNFNDNNFNINNNRYIFNTLQTDKMDFINSNFDRNNHNSNSLKRKDIKNKRNIFNNEFDNSIKKGKSKAINKIEYKVKNIRYYEFIKDKNLNKNKIINIKEPEKKNSKKKEKIKIIEENKSKQLNKEIFYLNYPYSEEELEEKYLIRDIYLFTNNMINMANRSSKMKNCIIKVLKNEGISEKEYKRIASLFLSIYKEEKILDKIMNYCDNNTLNKLSLINKHHYEYIKPLIYQRIKLKIKYINENNKNINNIIKKSVLQYTPLSNLSSAMVLKKYKDLLYELNDKYDQQIKKDLLRTAPDDISFKYGKENYNKLYHILSAYSNYNKNIGYVQGLNFLAAHCMYIYQKEIDAFIFLDGLIQKFKLENLFGANNELNDKLNEVEIAVSKWCPEINNHLKKISLNYDFFTCKWMVTLFSSHMNIKYLFQLWDYLIIFGWKFFKGFVIGVIKYKENLIKQSSLETITKIMNDILKAKEFENNFYNIINDAFIYINKEKEIL